MFSNHYIGANETQQRTGKLFFAGFFSSCREVDVDFHKELIYIRILIEAFKHILCYCDKVCGIVR